MACSNCNKVLTKVSHIIKGNVKYIFNITDKDVDVSNRLIICNSCNDKKHLITLGSSSMFLCNHCNCIIQAKVRVKEEHCPINKW